MDRVKIGIQVPEREHELKGEKTRSGTHRGRTWRHAEDGGWFSYRMKVPSDEPATLACTYWGGDSGARTFDILVDGQKIATQTLDNPHPAEFFTVEYPIPEELTEGKDEVTVRFDAHPGNHAGGVFELYLLEREK